MLVKRKRCVRCVRARANLRALMTQKSCAVRMRNAILRNHLKVIPLKLFYYQTFFETWRNEHS